MPAAFVAIGLWYRRHARRTGMRLPWRRFDELGLTDGDLGGHIRILEQAELIQVHKGYEGRRPCSWLRLTRNGRSALRHEIAALQRLVERVQTAERDKRTQKRG